MNVEEKERELFGVKHDQLVVNIRKLMLQKKFLEKQLDKDSAEVQLEMNKIQIEIQQEGDNNILYRFRQVYQAVMDQMGYVRQIVGFMDIDQEAVQGGGMSAAAPVTYDEVVKEINENLGRGGAVSE